MVLFGNQIETWVHLSFPMPKPSFALGNQITEHFRSLNTGSAINAPSTSRSTPMDPTSAALQAADSAVGGIDNIYNTYGNAANSTQVNKLRNWVSSYSANNRATISNRLLEMQSSARRPWEATNAQRDYTAQMNASNMFDAHLNTVSSEFAQKTANETAQFGALGDGIGKLFGSTGKLLFSVIGKQFLNNSYAFKEIEKVKDEHFNPTAARGQHVTVHGSVLPTDLGAARTSNAPAPSSERIVGQTNTSGNTAETAL